MTLLVLCSGCRGDDEAHGPHGQGRLAPVPQPPAAPRARASETDVQERIRRAAELMLRFAERTGLDSDRPQQRYLWTDAFAVCNFLGLAAATGEARHRELALSLVERVHGTLGRHRPDDLRSGWLSGLGEQEGAAHPTRGGLRIGKRLPERGERERFDENLEWDRDGQYFHYLTQWMHALDQVARATGEPRFNAWARELAEVAVRRFSQLPADGGPGRMFWKMSIDLTRPLVPSMGQHDPLAGYVACLELTATAERMPQPAAGPRLAAQAEQLAAMFESLDLATDDPLGLGGLLLEAFAVHRLGREGARVEGALLERLLADARSGLSVYARHGELLRPAERRLAFRELGLAVGLHGVARMAAEVEADARAAGVSTKARAELRALSRYADMADTIESFWLEPAHQRVQSFTEHRDINEVMLATSLVPEGYLGVPPP